MNSSRESLPSMFLSICRKILSVLFSGVDSSSGIFITDPTWWGFFYSHTLSYKFEFTHFSGFGREKHLKKKKKAFYEMHCCVSAAHKYRTVWNIHSLLIVDNVEMKNSTELICVAISRGEAALGHPLMPFQPQKQKHKIILQQNFKSNFMHKYNKF